MEAGAKAAALANKAARMVDRIMVKIAAIFRQKTETSRGSRSRFA
jgi:hypothetical protein